VPSALTYVWFPFAQLGPPLNISENSGYLERVSRIRRAFERRFRELLTEAGARQIDKGIQWLFTRAQSDVGAQNLSLSHALAGRNIALAEKLHRLRKRRGAAGRSECLVFCDAGLGGLARWLRASGCDARWVQDIGDAEIVSQAEALGAIIITTDSFLLDRRPIAHGRVRAIWVPPTLTKFEQLQLVHAELDLPETESRCMRCGGELIAVDKESVRDRIPPRAFVWLDEYFVCARCGQLFWHGTHWQRITRKLDEVTR
jgi:uncharacterized protein with PIN domain